MKIKILQILGLLSLAFYSLWNVHFLIKKEIPISILYKLTGIPSPTTGMFRSLQAIVNLDYQTFINNNPIVVFLLPLLVFIIGKLIYKRFQNESVYLNLSLSRSLCLILVSGEATSIYNYLI